MTEVLRGDEEDQLSDSEMKKALGVKFLFRLANLTRRESMFERSRLRLERSRDKVRDLLKTIKPF